MQWTLWTQLDDLNFADDLVLLSHNHSQMQDKTILLETTSAGTGLKINRKKTELMKMNTIANRPVTVGGEPIREVESFVYMGSVVDQQGGRERDVTARIGKARAAFYHAQAHLGIWRNQHENQIPHLQLQCEVSAALLMWDMGDNTDDATKHADILWHLSEDLDDSSQQTQTAVFTTVGWTQQAELRLKKYIILPPIWNLSTVT